MGLGKLIDEKEQKTENKEKNKAKYNKAKMSPTS